MKRAISPVAVWLSAAAVLACGKDPVERVDDPQLTLSADSVVVDVGVSASVTATVRYASEPAQFVSRDPGVATVEGDGTIRGVAIGSTYVVAALSGRADVRDSVRVRVLPPGSTPVAGQWGFRAPLIAPNSELAFAEANGKIYLLGGYPASRQTSRTVQVYDVAGDRWEFGPQLPQPNNHGMAAGVNGKVYLIGGQTSDVSDQGYQNTVYELDPATGVWSTKAPMPTARGGGVAVVHDGKIYVAGGRPPHGHDFAVYDPAADRWEVLPELPSQRNHLTGAAINGRIHVLGGRLGHGLSPEMSAAHEVYDPQTRTWTTAAPMLRARSGMNGVMARGCFHVWGGEGPAGMFPDHDYYDPRTNQWSSLPGMPIPVHGVYGSAHVNGLIWVAGGGTGIGGNHGSLYNQVYRPAVSCE
ncbi:MAG TPA: kelch repeat-containing protein [Longimicrobium sp.]